MDEIKQQLTEARRGVDAIGTTVNPMTKARLAEDVIIILINAMEGLVNQVGGKK